MLDLPFKLASMSQGFQMKITSMVT